MGWEWTMYNVGTGMGMGIAMREWEGMGLSKCGKIPEPQDSHYSSILSCRNSLMENTNM